MKLRLMYVLILIFLVNGFIANGFLYSNERKFTYVYQSGVLGKGAKELEIWTTPKLGKQNEYYARLEHRLEFEIGLSNRLQTAFYINFRNTTSDNGTGVNTTRFDFKGFSTEFKYQFLNPALHAIGFAFYGELGLNTDEVELETKLIFDKKIKRTTLALNLAAEPEWELTPGKAEYKLKFESNLGLSYSFNSSLSAGIEIRNANVYSKDNGLEHSALFGGPVISYSQPEWWMAFTVMPQLAGFKGKSDGSNLNLNEFTKFEARLLFSFHL